MSPSIYFIVISGIQKSTKCRQRNKKTIIQISLVLVLILINFVVFNFYYQANSKKDQVEVNENDFTKKNIATSNNDIIENLKYTSNNTRGDKYELFADFGEANPDNPNIMFLTNVKGRIISKDKPVVLLVSNFANFNTQTFETTFIKNVKLLPIFIR